MSSLILYPINIESAPNWVIRNSFARHFHPFQEYDWVNIAKQKTLPKTQEEFLKILKDKKPDYCFMQLQNPVNMTVPMIREMSKHTKIINWSGDVRTSKDWYDWFIAIGKEIHLTLFSNETDPEILANAGCRADYLQVGYDNIWYTPKLLIDNYPEIVYCANDYGSFQLSKYRAEVALRLKKEFGDRFKLFGNGWDKWGIKASSVQNVMESNLYNGCKIAISVSNFSYKRYYSDRLLRIMGCGAFALSHVFEGMKKDFTPGYDLESFKDLNELVEKCRYYLSHDAERNSIAGNAYHTAITKCTWDVRCKELICLLEKYK